MAGKTFEVPEAGSDAYLTYSVQDAPSTSYAAYLHSIGKSYTWFRRNFKNGENSEGYMNWKYATEQNYKNYLAAYNANYNDYHAKRNRMEAAGFSGQYLANGLGAGFSSEGSSSASGFGQTMPGVKKAGTRGLERIMQSLELMNNAGIAMKNFGEGKAAMKYADSMGEAKLTTEKNKGESMFYDAGLKRYRYMGEEMLYNDPKAYGYEVNPKTGKWKFSGVDSDGNKVSGRNLRLESYLDNMASQKYQVLLREQQNALNSLTLENRKKYEAATMEAQKGLLEGKKAVQAVEVEYAEKLKQLGLAAPVIQLALQSLKMFMGK